MVGSILDQCGGREAGADDIVPHRCGKSNGVGRGFDAADIEFGKFVDVADDFIKLGGIGSDFDLGEFEASQASDAMDIDVWVRHAKTLEGKVGSAKHFDRRWRHVVYFRCLIKMDLSIFTEFF